MLWKVGRILELAFFYVGVGAGILLTILILLLMFATPAEGERWKSRGANWPEVRDAAYTKDVELGDRETLQ